MAKDRVRLSRPLPQWARLLGVAALVGVCAGLAAAGLEFCLHQGTEFLIGRYTELGEAEILRFRIELLALPTLGGLLSGVIVTLLCPSATGHGTDVLVRAFHRQGGKLPLRGPAVKAAASIGVISCGGSAGPEGPIAALGAAIGSTIGAWLPLTPRERRLLLVAGCGAGVGAIFQCPLGGALFAASILYREPDLETDALVPALVASVVGYSVFMSFWGYGHHLLAGADELTFTSPRELIPVLLLAVICAGTCGLFRHSMHFVENLVARTRRLPRWLAPALGGLATGCVACLLPQVMDGQYLFVQKAMDGTLAGGWTTWDWWHWLALFAAVLVGKSIATALTVGSGGSGGVLGPSVFLGGVAGALVGALLEAVGPTLFTQDSENLRRALIPLGMAGILSASMRAPLASLVMILEMMGSDGLIVPLMLVCGASYVLGQQWGLNDEQVRTTADSPAHAGDAVVHILENAEVREIMRADWRETVSTATTLRELVAMLKPGTRPVFAVVDHGRVVGLISPPDIERIMDEPAIAEAVIAEDLMSTELTAVHPDDDAYHALTMMAKHNHVTLPVVSRDEEQRFLGMLTRDDIYDAVRRRIEDLHRHLLLDHEALTAIEHEEELHQLLIGVSPPKQDNIQRLLVPVQAVGRSLRESDFRRQFGVQVIAIELPDGTVQCPPDPDTPLQTTQRLVAIVTEREEDA
jgi:CIC family chloride channel protein